MSKSYFTVDELIRSETARKNRISNNPDALVRQHLEQVIEFLNPLREAWGSAITITSGYRCPELNKIVGGSNTSVHPLGWAVDMQPKNGRFSQFCSFMKVYLKDKKFDQCLIERSSSARWVHLGLYNRQGLQRKQIKNMNV